MGCCTANLCVHGSKASMSQIRHGTFLKRAILSSLKPYTKRMPATPQARTLFVSLHWNATLASEKCRPSSLHSRMFICRHATHRALPKEQGFPRWRALNSMSDGIGPTTQGEESMSQDSFKGTSEAKKTVVIVESPVKARTIKNYLGSDYVVLPTYGHVRDLAARVNSVRPDDDYEMVWEACETAHIRISKIKEALTDANCLVLASDPDREGEAIAWHVFEVLKADGVLKDGNPKVVRVTFNEITKDSILRAMQGPRDICSTLVAAYLARRALDRLIGYALSPVLWRKLPGSRSAGRVQSVALKLVCEREKEIEDFVPQQFWTVEAYARLEQGSEETNLFPIRPTHVNGKKIEKFSFGSDDANLLSERLRDLPLKVSSVQIRLKQRSPPQPYITSTLQMDAQAKLGYGAMRTMTLAQKLYEGVKLENEQLTGLITYMRTDGLQLSNEAVNDIRALVAERYGDKYVPAECRKFSSKVKNAQEAHEAIRPTDIYRLPSQLVHVLEKDALLLYTLIWKRTVACQMEEALCKEALVNFVTEDGSTCLQAVSSFLSFPGFLAAVKDNHGIITTTEDAIPDESEYKDIEVGKDASIWSLKIDDVVVVKKAESQQHFTRPPSRFSEGLLVKAMEELGIGRPSTYASMLKTLESRNYVKIENHRITPETRGRMVTAFLSHYFSKYVDYEFTAQLEAQLDEVSGGQVEWKEVLRGFWPNFESVVASVIKVPVEEVIEMLQGTLASHCFKGFGVSGHTCPSCGKGKMTLRLSRFGSGYFFGCDSYPDCSFKAVLFESEDTKASLGEEKDENVALKMIENYNVLIDIDPETNLEVRVKCGPYGYYIQLGQECKGRCSWRVPKGVEPSDLTLDKAKELMKFPLSLGNHPDDGKPVSLGIGKASYYVRHGNLVTLVPKAEEPHKVTLQRAVELLKGKRVLYVGPKIKSRHKQETSENSAVLEARKVSGSAMEVGDDDPEAISGTKVGTTNNVGVKPKAKKSGKQRIVRIEGETTGESVMLATVDNLEEDKPKAQGLPHSKTIESFEADQKSKKPKAKRVSFDEVSLEGDANSCTTENGSNEKGKVKPRRTKSRLAVETVEKAKTVRKKVAESEEQERTSENAEKPSIDSVEQGKPKAKRLLL